MILRSLDHNYNITHEKLRANPSGDSSIANNRVRIQTQAKILTDATLPWWLYREAGGNGSLLALVILSNNNKANQQLYNMLKNFN